VDDSWRDALENVAKRARLPFGARAAQEVRALSDAYNRGETLAGAFAARLAFFFARDVRKAEAAVRELVWTKTIPSRAIRVFDLGAGLGAATWGILRAVKSPVRATLVDCDRAALDLALEISREHKDPSLDVETVCADVGVWAPPLQGADIVIAANVLSEMAESVERDAELLLRWLGFANEEGSLVVIEPALRARTRRLHEVRDALCSRGVTIFAPCLHARACPMLARPKDWCHEDLPIDLPAWLAPVAREAGLRWEGLTFSYLILRKDSKTLASHVPAGALRVVSSVIRTKGKREAELCGADADGRAMQLDRDETPENKAFHHVVRGDVITVDPAPKSAERFRIGRDAKVVDVRVARD